MIEASGNPGGPGDPGVHFRFTRSVLASSMLIMGACGIIYEYVLGVLGNHLMGSSHEQIFVIIGIMMFAMGLGAVAQRRLMGQLVDRFLTFELLLGVLGGFSCLIIYTMYVYTTVYEPVLYGIAFVIGLCIGLEIPLLIRINAQYAASLRTNLSEILCMDYVGSLVGALLFAYVLLTRLSIGRIGLAVGCVNTLLAVGGVVYFWPLVRRPRLLLGACVVSLAALVVAMFSIDGWMAKLEQRCFEDPIIHSQTSPYQHFVLTQRGPRLRLYINGHLQFCSLDEAIYHEMLVHAPMAVAPSRKRVLILGGGDGLALREVLKYDDVEQIVLVDIDPVMIQLASQQPDMVRVNQHAFLDARVQATPGPGVTGGEWVTITRPTKLAKHLIDDTRYPLADVRVITIDADLFLRGVDQQFDVVILDFPDPKSLELAKLYSVGFYRQLARCLSPDAVVAVQSTSPRRAKRVFLCIAQTLRAAGFKTLPYQDHLPSFGDWGWHLAWRNDVTPKQIHARLRDVASLSIDTRYVTAVKIAAAAVFGKGQLQPDQPIQPNTTLQPVLIHYYRQGYQ